MVYLVVHLPPQTAATAYLEDIIIDQRYLEHREEHSYNIDQTETFQLGIMYLPFYNPLHCREVSPCETLIEVCSLPYQSDKLLG